ncbi:MAG: hypothetical protein KGR26_04190 [Cyanobacteria bacterium REEB65]|nr:hypothetical protein [Cyanobacteria bacterium REEB65]
MEIGSIRPAEVAGSEPVDNQPVRPDSLAAPASQESLLAARTPGQDFRSIGDVQQLVASVKSTAEDTAGQLQSGADGEGGGGSPNDGGESQVLAAVNKNADKVFQAVMQYAGDDPKLLQQAKAMVTKVFDSYRGQQPTPMLTFMTQERVMGMIEARLAQMANGSEVNYSA